MAIVLSGHGLKCPTSKPFRLPRGFILYFWTREGIPVQDDVAGRIEASPNSVDVRLASQTVSRGGLVCDYWLMDPTNPPLKIFQPPPPHHQTVPGKGQNWKLSDIMAGYALAGWGNLVDPTPVHWCACRSNLPEPSWIQTLRPFSANPDRPAWRVK